VRSGQEIAKIYSLDVAEVRLPISDEQLAYLNLPRGTTNNGPFVTIFGRVANRKYQWRGRIARTESSLDPKSRVKYAVVQVQNPDEASSGLPSLNVGMYVDAEIQGRQYRGIYVLPRKALRYGKRLMVIDGEHRLHFRTVELLRDERDRVLIQSGLNDGDKVVVSPVDTPIDGMEVRILGEEENDPSLDESEEEG
jgi:multidrug efflux pump subunit AcrA (membrane-fusion protein)